MEAVFVVLCAALLIQTTFGDCHTGQRGTWSLGVQTSVDTTWAHTDNGLYANVYAGNRWIGWQFLDNANCDDYQQGAWDYFDDFQSVTAQWEALALYQCGVDGVLVESISYGPADDEAVIYNWDAGVFGPFPEKCAYSSGGPGFTDMAFDLYLDGDGGNMNSITGCCHGVIMGLNGHNTPGQIWTGPRPGIPDCALSGDSAVPGMPLSRSRPPRALTVHDFEAASSYYFAAIKNYLLVAVAVGTLVFVSNVCMCGAMMRGRKRLTFSYQKAGMNSDDGL